MVMEERRLRTENSHFGLLEEQLESLVYQAHPYRWPVIGWMDDIARIGRDDCLAFFRTYYAPGQRLRLRLRRRRSGRPAASHRGSLRLGSSQVPRSRLPSEASRRQRGERRAVVRHPAQAAAMLAGFRGPAAREPDTAVLDVLQACLSMGEGSRLRRRLVQEAEVAVSVGVGWTWRADPGVFVLSMELAPGASPRKAEAALWAEIDRVASRGVAERELARARSLLRSSLLHEFATRNGVAHALGQAEALLGDWREAGQGARALPGRHPGGRAAGRPILARPVAPERGLARAGAFAVSGIVLPDLRETRLPGGLRIAVAHRPGVPLAAARLAVRAGSVLDPEGGFGLAHLVALSARRGAGRRSGRAIDDLVESLGANLAGGAEEDATVHGLSAPVEVLPRLLEVLGAVVARPTFPAAEFERLRRSERAELAHDSDEASTVADRALLEAVYAGHAYGHPVEGAGRDLARIRRRDAAAFHSRWFGPGAALLVVTGPVDVDGTVEEIERRLGRWRPAPATPPEIPPPGAVRAGSSSWTSRTPPRSRSASAGWPSRGRAPTTSRRWWATRCWAADSPLVSWSPSG